MKKQDESRYTTILHDQRIKAGLSCNEYVIADSVQKLSSKPSFPICTAGQPYLAEFLGISIRSVINIMKRLQDKGYIFKVMDGEQFRGWQSTDKWHAEFVAKQRRFNGGEKSAGGGDDISQPPRNQFTSPLKRVQGGSEESSPNKNSYNNSNTNIIARIKEDFYMKTGRTPSDNELQKKLSRLGKI